MTLKNAGLAYDFTHLEKREGGEHGIPPSFHLIGTNASGKPVELVVFEDSANLQSTLEDWAKLLARATPTRKPETLSAPGL